MVRLYMHCDMSAHGNKPHVMFEYPATQATPAPYALLFLAGCSWSISCVIRTLLDLLNAFLHVEGLLIALLKLSIPNKVATLQRL